MGKKQPAFPATNKPGQAKATTTPAKPASRKGGKKPGAK